MTHRRTILTLAALTTACSTNQLATDLEHRWTTSPTNDQLNICTLYDQNNDQALDLVLTVMSETPEITIGENDTVYQNTAAFRAELRTEFAELLETNC